MNSLSVPPWLVRVVLGFALTSPASALGTAEPLSTPRASAGARVGASVAIGTDTIVVGAPGDDERGPYAGAAYVYVRHNDRWEMQTKLLGPPTPGDRSLGESVAISRDVIVLGAPLDDSTGIASGAAYVYVRQGGTWTLQSQLTPADAAPNQQFGDAVSIDGNTLIVGAYLDNTRGRNAGAVYLFARSGAHWIQRAKLTASDASDFAFFGSALAIKGNAFLVGAPTAETAYLFGLQNGQYVEQARIAAFARASNDYSAFGASVSLDSHALVIGAPLDSEKGHHAGAAYTFHRNGSYLVPHAKLVATTPEPEAEFGTAVAIDDFTLAIGAPYAGEQNQGVVEMFHRQYSRWLPRNQVATGAGDSSAFFGASVDLHDAIFLGGAPGFADSPGKAYVVTPSRTE